MGVAAPPTIPHARWHVRNARAAAGNPGAAARQRGRARRPGSARGRDDSVPLAARGALQCDGPRRSARHRGVRHGLQISGRDAGHGIPRCNRIHLCARQGTAKNVDEVRRLPGPGRFRAVRGETHRDRARHGFTAVPVALGPVCGARAFPSSGEAGCGLLSAGDYSRSILRSPCAGVHHSTTSIVAFSLRCVCTTSAMSA